MSNRPDKLTIPRPDLRKLVRVVIARFVMAVVVLGLMLFLPAGTIYYWQAWAWLLTLGVPMAGVAYYLFRNDPALLERRMHSRETQGTQKLVIALSVLFVIPLLVIPGLDVRFGWSNVPVAVVILSDVMVLAGYLLVGLVFRTNSYASRVVEVEKGQKVISTGHYAVVRHPMYSGVLVFYLFTPIALGSYWAVIPAVLSAGTLVIRILGEERELRANLEGYTEYTANVRYRLIPGVW